jgi:hypothetical protein
VIFDEFGTSFLLWGYPDMIFPIITPLFPADTTIIPVCFMLVYQYFPKGKPFFIANAALSALFAFVVEPIFQMLDLFVYRNWNGFYTFIGFIPLPYVVRWIVESVKKKSESK